MNINVPLPTVKRKRKNDNKKMVSDSDLTLSPVSKIQKRTNKGNIISFLQKLVDEYYYYDNIEKTIDIFVQNLNYDDEYKYNRLLFLEMRIYTQFLLKIWNDELTEADTLLLESFVNGDIVRNSDYVLSCDWSRIYDLDASILDIPDLYLTKYQKLFDSSGLSSRFILGSIVEFGLGLMMRMMGLDVKVTGETSKRYDFVVRLKNGYNAFYSIKSFTRSDTYPGKIILINVLSNEKSEIKWCEPTILYIKGYGLIYFDPYIFSEKLTAMVGTKLCVDFKHIFSFIQDSPEMFIRLENNLAKEIEERDEKISPNFAIFESLVDSSEPWSKYVKHIV
ncbi:MAG: hypothetical protein QXS19_08175 [Candidatus Methanomethylicia archaeon]